MWKVKSIHQKIVKNKLENFLKLDSATVSVPSNKIDLFSLSEEPNQLVFR